MYIFKYLVHIYHVIMRHTHEYELRDGTKMIDLGISRKQLISGNLICCSNSPNAKTHLQRSVEDEKTK